MKQIYTNLSFVLCMVFTSSIVIAQQDWPKTITTAAGDKIKIYQPQPESFSNNILKSRSAVSVITGDKTEPVFGVFWSVAQTSNNDGKTVHVQSIQVTDIKFPADIEENQVNEIKNSLQAEIGKMSIDFQQQELESALNLNQQETKLSSNLNNNPPKVIYTNKPSTLVLIDGEPKLQMNSDWGVEVVVNSPFTIVKNEDGKFYLYGAKRWYVAPAATGPFNYTSNVPGNLGKVETAINNSTAQNSTDNNNTENTFSGNSIPQIIVSTEPAELIQSNGEANFVPVEGTGLLYVKNSSNDIFMDVNSQQYYVLLSGRWYKAASLNSQWQYIPSNKLPGDFANIPEGSPKDNVLASVAGTDAADDAVMNAQVPQTAKVDRKTATANVTYDGDPEFARIDGTHLQYALNSSSTVLKYNGSYYSVDNGVWFESNNPSGPWTVSTYRPEEVELIPPSYPVYNAKYVYVYDVTPDYVYMGYTPGYLNTFIYGPTIVYGTGYYYRPWYRHYYYPRPYTWGFSVGYTPWYGWGIGFDFSYGWFNIGFGRSSWNYWHGGWWGGPSIYRPFFCNVPYRTYGYYGSRSYGYYGGRNNININVNYTNNIYRYRRDVVTHDNRAWNGGRRGNNGFANNNDRGNNGSNSYNNRFNRNNNGNNNDRGGFYDRSGNRTNDRNRFNNNNRSDNDRGRFNGRSNNTGDNNRFNNGFGNNNNSTNDRNRFNNNNNSNNDRNRFNNNNNITTRPGTTQPNNGSTTQPNNNNSQWQQHRQQRSFGNNDRPAITSRPSEGGGFQRPPMQQRSASPSQPQFHERSVERRSDGGGGRQQSGGDRGSNGNGGGGGRSSGGGNGHGGGRRG
jgi:hypothetical protein